MTNVWFASHYSKLRDRDERQHNPINLNRMSAHGRKSADNRWAEHVRSAEYIRDQLVLLSRPIIDFDAEMAGRTLNLGVTEEAGLRSRPQGLRGCVQRLSPDRRSRKAREVRVHLVEDEQDVLRREVQALAEQSDRFVRDGGGGSRRPCGRALRLERVPFLRNRNTL
jgi:hypothetical protein